MRADHFLYPWFTVPYIRILYTYTFSVEAAFRFRSGASRLHSANLLRMRQRALRLRSLSSAIPPLRGFAYLRIRKTYTYIYTIYVYVICISFLNTIISRKKFKFLLIFSDPNFGIFWKILDRRNSWKNMRPLCFWKIFRFGKSYKIIHAHMYPILCTLRPSHIFCKIIYVLCARTIIFPKIDTGFWKILRPRAFNV